MAFTIYTLSDQSVQCEHKGFRASQLPHRPAIRLATLASGQCVPVPLNNVRVQPCGEHAAICAHAYLLPPDTLHGPSCIAFGEMTPND
eukprot:1195636-Prorocentrum_minimum.AAC.5